MSKSYSILIALLILVLSVSLIAQEQLGKLTMNKATKGEKYIDLTKTHRMGDVTKQNKMIVNSYQKNKETLDVSRQRYIKRMQSQQQSKMRERIKADEQKRLMPGNQFKNDESKFLVEEPFILKRMGIWHKVRHLYQDKKRITGDVLPLNNIYATVTESEPNDDYSNANSISYGDLVDHATINPAGDKDYFSFNGIAGDIVSIEIMAKRLEPVSELDSYIFLFDTDGVTELTQNDDYYGQDSYIINYELPSTGTFYIKVEDWANTQEGREPEGGEDYYYNMTLTNTPIETGSVSGTVARQDNGAIIEGTEIIVRNSGYPYNYMVGVTTDANGEYNISGLAEGSYYVQATGWAEVNGNWERIYLEEYYLESANRDGATKVDVTGDVIGIDFTLEEGGKISGIVTDESGNPIEGAWVWANNYDGSGGGGVNTQPDGTYRISGLRSNDYRVDVNADGYVLEFYNDTRYWEEADRVPVTAPDETENINFELELAGSISGIVTDESGNPIEGAWVWAGLYDGDWGNDAHTQSDGTYQITGLPSDDYRVEVEVEGYIREYYNDTWVWDEADQVPVTAPDETGNINFDLTIAGSIAGIVTDESGNPISDIWLDTYNVDLDRWGFGFMRSELDGTYKIDGLPSGNYKVWIDAEDYVGEHYDDALNFDDADIIIVTAPNETGGINFQLGQGGSISGIVTDESGNPIENAWVWANMYDDGYGNGSPTLADGTYQIKGLPTGDYRVEVEVEGYVREFYDDVLFWDDATPVSVTELNDTENINFALSVAGSITGTVTDESGNPISDIWWDIYNVDLDRWGFGFMRSELDGTYKIDGLPSGNYKVWAGAEGLVGEWYNDVLSFEDATIVSVTAPDETGGIDFQLAEGGSITGIVKDESGNPLAFVDVNANLWDGGWGTGTQTRQDGTYELVGIPIGDYRVVAWKEGYQRQYWDHVHQWGDATPVAVVSPRETQDINFDLIILVPADITFQADMTNFIANGWFDPGNLADSIVVNGNFNGWDSHEKMIPDPVDPNIYTYETVISMVPGDMIYWKFKVFPPEKWLNQGWEIGDNRELEFTGEDIVLDPIEPNIEYTDQSITQDVTVTFSVDMSTYAEADPFSIISLQGDKPPLDWSPGSTPMADPDGDNIWTVDIVFPEGTGREVQYKYTAGDDPWYWEPFGSNREFEIDDSSPTQVLNIDYWGYLQRPQVSGTVSYDGTNRPVSGADITLIHPEGTISEATNVNGQYMFFGIDPGEVTLLPSKEGDQRDAISASDAMLVLKYRAYLCDLTNDQKKAADVNEDRLVSAVDAIAILRYAAFFPSRIGHTGEWRFMPEDTSFTLTTDAAANFKAYLLGDVSLNWGSTVLAKAEESRVFSVVELTMENPQKCSDQEFMIPIGLENVNQEINALIFTLEYDSSLITYKSSSLTSLSHNFTLVDNGTEPGKVHFAMASVNGVVEPGKVLNLVFEAKKEVKALGADFNIARAFVNDLAPSTLNSLHLDFEKLQLGIPQDFALSNNYPNPFNPETIIEYQLPGNVQVSLRIFDILGKEVRTLVNEEQDAGYYKVLWDGKNEAGRMVASGLYFYVLEAENYRSMKKMILTK